MEKTECKIKATDIDEIKKQVELSHREKNIGGRPVPYVDFSLPRDPYENKDYDEEWMAAKAITFKRRRTLDEYEGVRT